jgi:hypothetical protein
MAATAVARSADCSLASTAVSAAVDAPSPAVDTPNPAAGSASPAVDASADPAAGSAGPAVDASADPAMDSRATGTTVDTCPVGAGSPKSGDNAFALYVSEPEPDTAWTIEPGRRR